MPTFFLFLFRLHFLLYKLLEVTLGDQSFYLFLEHNSPLYHSCCCDELDKIYRVFTYWDCFSWEKGIT